MMTILLIVIFLAGIGNFAMHRWLLESGHPLVEAAIAPIRRTLGGLSGRPRDQGQQGRRL
jgi:hypothetical protein